MPSSRNLSISQFKFGIEIELGIPDAEFEENVELPPSWISHDEHCGVEVVSPPLCGRSGILAVRECIRRIWKSYNKIKFYDCGLHVHVDIQHFRMLHVKRLLKLASRFDEVIYSIMDPRRYNNHFCKHVNYSNNEIDACRTLDELYKLQRDERYSGVNLLAFSKHGTVEFRYARGTADWQIVYSLLSLYLRMVAFATSSLEIPNITIPGWNGAGPSFLNDKYAELNNAKDIFFNLLEIKGGTREVLNGLFEKNRLHVVNDDVPTELKKKFPSTKKIQFATGLRTRY